MRSVSSIELSVADELQSLAAGLRNGTVSLDALPSALCGAIGRIPLEADGDVPPVRDDDSISAEELVQKLGRFSEIVRTRPDALELDPEPVMELVVEDQDDTSSQSAVELLGLRSVTESHPPPERQTTAPQPLGPAPFLPEPKTDVPALKPLPASRYELKGELGVGGQGEVREVFDRHLQRIVALKVLREELAHKPQSRRSFLREAILTAQLSHPCILPILDVGEVAGGAPGYTMKRIRGRSLRNVLRARRSGEVWAVGFSRRRLLEILVQVAHGVGYAHHRGVVHRDLKPANLMLGAFGEVLILDWGIAKVVGRSSHDTTEGPALLAPQFLDTGSGNIKGTPAYMAPEQARGDRDSIGPWTDTHALGLILYEILVGEPARPSGSADDVIAEARFPITQSPETRRVENQLLCDPIPEELDQICARCLEPDTQERFPDGESLAEALQAYLDGQKRREQAQQKVQLGQEQYRESATLDKKLSELLRHVESTRSEIAPWAEVSSKRQLWQLEQEAAAMERERDELMDQAVASFTQALDGDPENPLARKGLARLYYERLVMAERLGRVRDARQIETQVRRLDDGALASQLRGYGSLFIDTEPDRAEIWVYEYDVVDRIMVPARGRKLGRSPVEVDALPMGRYLMVVRLRGGKEIYYPVLIRRHSRWEGKIHLHLGLDERFIHIPEGPCIVGGDRRAPGALRLQEIHVPDFAIARLPITCKEYLRFLNSLPIDEAAERIPRTSKLHGGTRWWNIEGARIQIPRVDEASGRWDLRYPVRYISRLDAEAYARWRSGVEDLPLRLPTEAEWEKAGRGADGRSFPWGDAFDATFCKMRDSRPGRPDPEPVGVFKTDRSPYGVLDLAGSISEWTSDPFDRYQLLGVLKGGYWRGAEATCRLSRRFASDPNEPAPFGGFRLVLDMANDRQN